MATSHVTDEWMTQMEMSSLNSYIVRRYIATPNGVLRIYPGSLMDKAFDPTRRQWWVLGSHYERFKKTLELDYISQGFVESLHWLNRQMKYIQVIYYVCVCVRVCLYIHMYSMFKFVLEIVWNFSFKKIASASCISVKQWIMKNIYIWLLKTMLLVKSPQSLSHLVLIMNFTFSWQSLLLWYQAAVCLFCKFLML